MTDLPLAPTPCAVEHAGVPRVSASGGRSVTLLDAGRALSGSRFAVAFGSSRFIGKKADRAKILVWHRGGFLLLYKRLEKGRFRIPAIAPGSRTATLDATELAMPLDGIDVTRVPRPALWEPPRATMSPQSSFA